ncbi:L-type lectin-domain containing receptor kinase IX.1-like [Argentina anserina]|uniref:L-type lectin-domain containing receptor kinase IX.1-like n=1 Tax=Argentina anserina TaxID=57926 RepID=UPI0021767559|nr:L-type lectin-domain containing receptor kinase IX.1-like [Potentilla anserina]
MAVNSTLLLSLTQFQLHLLLFLVLPFSATPLTFNFPNFPPSVASDIFMEGNASADGSLRLTKSAVDVEKNQSVGRATYHQPFLLRQISTGKLADFTSNFTFVIDSRGNPLYGDGLAFFIAPNGSELNSTIGRGGALGLPVINPPDTESSYMFPFVAVEFDIFNNPLTSVQDPAGDHVGIDVNSTKSLITGRWNGSVVNGGINCAMVSYDSVTKNLSVAYTSYVNGAPVMRYVHHKVDLEKCLPEWVIVGFSAATGATTALHKINSWSFNSTLLDDENSTSVDPAPIEPTSGNANVGLVVGLVVGGVVISVGLLSLIWFLFCRKRRETTEESSDDDTRVLYDLDAEDFEKGTGPRKFSYNELVLATSDFAQGEKLGEGGFGGVYRGFIKDMNSYAAVKKISRGSKQGLKEYAAEVSIISRLRHRNLVQLIGWCHEKKLLLVYEFMPNGSLDSHLFKEKSLLTWEVRYNIAHGLASGLLYLHQEWDQCVLHRDIKSSNVMLDANYNAKLGDFGLAKLVDHGKLSQTTVVAGTMGYMAMEYVTTGKASKETDVYSFGVVALEIACGRKPIDYSYEKEQINMVEWVWELYGEGKIIEAADPKLCGEFDEKQMECLMIVGLWYSHPDHNCRPLIQQAIQVLNFEVPLPNLPLKMPVAFAPQLTLSMLYSGDTTRGQSESSGYDSTINSSQLISSSTTNSNPTAS